MNSERCESAELRWLALLFLLFLTVNVNAVARPRPVAQALEATEEHSCHKFVQEFYNWYIGRDKLHDEQHLPGSSTDDVLKLRPKALSPKLFLMLSADSYAQAHANEIVGLDFDPFFNSQDPSPQLVVESVQSSKGHCSVTVAGLDHGIKRETIFPELLNNAGKWDFVNFHYRDKKVGNYDLIQILAQNAKARAIPNKP